MTWDGIKKRTSDGDGEDPSVTLARIDENIKFMKAGAEVVRIELAEHKRDDTSAFKSHDEKLEKVNRTLWMASGGVCVIVFILNFFHR